MYKYSIDKINKSKLILNPFPYFVVNSLIPPEKLIEINKMLPSFDEVTEDEGYFQSLSETKKTILPTSKLYKELNKSKIFKDINLMFKKIQPFVIKKFQYEINKYVKKKYQNSVLKFHSSFSLMKEGYIKSSHIDRRDHLVHALFYPFSTSDKGGEIQVMKLKKHNYEYDVFPKKKEVSISKKYKIKNNFCIFTLNVPWSYHSVNKYNGKKDRKYFYFVYDFPNKNIGSKLKFRKKGNNLNYFWNSNVLTKSEARKKLFFAE
jgi:hypothetical protein